MRNHRIFSLRLLLTAVLLCLPAPAVFAQAPAPPAPPAPPLVHQGDQLSVLRGGRTVARNEVVDGDVVVVGGNLRVIGTIRGDAVVAGGDLILEDGATITGDALVTGGKLLDRGGRVEGEMRAVTGGSRERRVERHERVTVPAATEAMRVRHSWFAPIGEGLAGLISTLALGLVLVGMGAALVFYGLPFLRTVSETIRASAVRSAAVGMAASFLILPVFVALVALLAVSIIGIPLLLVAIPGYPLLVAAAGGFGLLAVAHRVGEVTAERRREWFAGRQNAYAYLFGGLLLLLGPLLVANLLTIAGLGFLSGLIKALVFLAAWAAATLGLGAVVLSRAGTRDDFAHRPYIPPADPDPLWGEEPRV